MCRFERAKSNRPLTANERKRLRELRKFLVENIMVRDLLDDLFAKGVISVKHLAGIRQQELEDDRTRLMLDIVERRSHVQYKLFVKCLQVTHPHVAGQ